MIKSSVFDDLSDFFRIKLFSILEILSGLLSAMTLEKFVELVGEPMVFLASYYVN